MMGTIWLDIYCRNQQSDQTEGIGTSKDDNPISLIPISSLGRNSRKSVIATHIHDDKTFFETK